MLREPLQAEPPLDGLEEALDPPASFPDSGQVFAAQIDVRHDEALLWLFVPVEPCPRDVHGGFQTLELCLVPAGHQLVNGCPIRECSVAPDTDHDVYSSVQDGLNELRTFEAPICMQTGAALPLKHDGWNSAEQFEGQRSR